MLFIADTIPLNLVTLEGSRLRFKGFLTYQLVLKIDINIFLWLCYICYLGNIKEYNRSVYPITRGNHICDSVKIGPLLQHLSNCYIRL